MLTSRIAVSVSPLRRCRTSSTAFIRSPPERIDNEGVGLGLAISKRLVDAMQGRLDVSSREGEGSHFELEVVLPIAEQIDESGATERDESDRKLTILVVDDDSISRLAATTLLRQQGHEVYEAENGALAIEMVHQQSFEVVLMDVHMPVMDGISATRQIRTDSDAAIAALPIIGLTASVMNDERENYIKSGMDAVVDKPIVIASLTRTIRHCLRS
ncbi:hypothetical protein BOW53_14590 [Solemya pervernicosa gill symbiont]|uniref:histidine kinase n=1 Tax=Solemya pervernicosa gill symbiont TaxID=642797 RepID=A0A1T2L0R2_9GAMM|nr:hypothetical protein BOW53_14590 [Solemya pervernicosa gill symbiont]